MNVYRNKKDHQLYRITKVTNVITNKSHLEVTDYYNNKKIDISDLDEQDIDEQFYPVYYMRSS